jgi:hypothetical protein
LVQVRPSLSKHTPLAHVSNPVQLLLAQQVLSTQLSLVQFPSTVQVSPLLSKHTPVAQVLSEVHDDVVQQMASTQNPVSHS